MHVLVSATLMEMQLSNYLRNQITFSGSATTDGGLTLGSWTRYRQSASASVFSGTGAFAAPRLSVSNGAMTLTAGNAGGAINANSGMWGCGTVMWGCSDVVGGMGLGIDFFYRYRS